jgi:hypothetical protein
MTPPERRQLAVDALADTDTVSGLARRDAVVQARSCNGQQGLCGVRIGAHDEIFQSGRPVLVGSDADSTSCYLLSLEDHRDGDTWGRSPTGPASLGLGSPCSVFRCELFA